MLYELRTDNNERQQRAASKRVSNMLDQSEAESRLVTTSRYPRVNEIQPVKATDWLPRILTRKQTIAGRETVTGTRSLTANRVGRWL